MLDEMQEKRGMIKLLLEMLKGSAADEVANGMKKPEGMPEGAKGLEIEKVSVLPHDEHAEPMSPEGETLASKVMPHGEPEGSPAEEAAESPAEEAHEDESVEESPMPAFSSFLKRKKK